MLPDEVGTTGTGTDGDARNGVADARSGVEAAAADALRRTGIRDAIATPTHPETTQARRTHYW